MASCQGARPGAIPGNRTTLDTPGASLRSRVSKTQLARGSTETACQLFLGSWQTSNALALQASLCGSVTHRFHHFQLRGTRLMHREKPHKLLQVGVIPPPQPLLVQGHHGIGNNCPCGSTVTSISHHFGSVAQSEEPPVVCGKVEGASPFGSANFKPYREADSQGFGVAFLHSSVLENRSEHQRVA